MLPSVFPDEHDILVWSGLNPSTLAARQVASRARSQHVVKCFDFHLPSTAMVPAGAVREAIAVAFAAMEEGEARSNVNVPLGGIAIEVLLWSCADLPNTKRY